MISSLGVITWPGLVRAAALLTGCLALCTAAAAGGNRFKASGPDMGAGEASELRTPL